MPTCCGDETDNKDVSELRRLKMDGHLPLQEDSEHQQPTYSWEDPNDRLMRDIGADFRLPTTSES